MERGMRMSMPTNTKTPTRDTEPPEDVEDTEVSSMSWVRIQELEYVKRICADVMKRMRK